MEVEVNHARVRWVAGEVLEWLAGCEENRYDGVLTDAPYGLGMTEWDELPSVEVWREVVRTVRPGGWVLCFGHQVTYHRLLTRMEAAGLEVCGWILWVHVMGAGGKTRLRRTMEPIAVTRVPGGSIPLNVRDCRVSRVLDRDRRRSPRGRKTSWGADGPDRRGPRHAESGGRMPADMIFSHAEGCSRDGCIPECPVAVLDRQVAESGRFFLELRGPKPRGREIQGNPHPTKKPLLLQTYLGTLIRPPGDGGRLFVPFGGTATEALGGAYGGWAEVEGVESDERWWNVGRERILEARDAGEDFLEDLCGGSSWVRTG